MSNVQESESYHKPSLTPTTSIEDSNFYNDASKYAKPDQNTRRLSGPPSDHEIGEQIYATESISKLYSRKATDEENASSESTELSHYEKQGNKDSLNDNTNKDSRPTEADSKQSQDGPPKQKEKVGLLHPSVKHFWRGIIVDSLKVWIILAFLVLIGFSIYWGALYDRHSHLHKLKMLVVIEDDVPFDGTTFGDSYQNILQNFTEYGTWKIVNGSQEINEYFENPTNLSDSILTKVHHRKMWSATHIHANATYNQYLTFKGDLNEAPLAVTHYYETGRDITSVTPYVVTTLKNVQQAFNKAYNEIAANILSNLSSDEKTDLIANNSSKLTTIPEFEFIDYRPYNDNTLLAPLQVGLIYLIILSFFLFMFFANIHRTLIPHVKIPQYLLYRILSNHLSYWFISLIVSCVSAAFQIDFTKAFGRGGFVIYWISTYLTMAAVGGANENMALLIFSYNPALLGCWLITFVILNVSPSFSPMILTNDFYRYGYIMPIHHSNEISKVIFLDVWKGELGRNYAVLIAWVVINTLLCPFILKYVGGVMAKKAKAEAEAVEKAANAAGELK